MSTLNENAKVTLTDLFTVVCFVAPVTAGVLEGWKVGTIGVVVGIASGLILGVLCAVGFRMYCISFADRFCFAAETASVIWQAMSAFLFVFLELMWVLGGSVFSQLTIRLVILQTAAS